jgi:hypothetical protein
LVKFLDDVSDAADSHGQSDQAPAAYATHKTNQAGGKGDQTARGKRRITPRREVSARI